MCVVAGKFYQLDRFYKERGRYLLDYGFPKDTSELFDDIAGQVVGAGMLVATATADGIQIYNYIFTGSEYRRYSRMNKTVSIALLGLRHF